MNFKVIRKAALFVSIAGFAAQSYAQSAETHTFTLRVECRKNSDRGCTASNRVCANAPEGHFFSAGQSVAGVHNNSWSPGHQPQCGVATTGEQGVPVAGGLMAPTSMCASLHAESGSGLGNLGKVAFVNCNYTAKINPLPQ